MMAGKWRPAMMRPMIFAFAVVALIAVSATMPRSHSSSIELSAAAMPSLQELHAMVGIQTLPAQEFEDQSLIYPTLAKR
jgi:hypothetical protein